MTKKKILHNFSIPLVILLLWPLIGFSQTSQSTQESDTVAAQIKPIPTVQIVQNIVEANSEIQQANQTITPKRNLIRIDSLYPEYGELINDKKELQQVY